MSKMFACFALMSLFSCTEQQSAKNYGGKMTMELRPGQKLVNATWKENNLWVLTRDIRPGETQEKYRFTESSDYGVWQGEITIVEK